MSTPQAAPRPLALFSFLLLGACQSAGYDGPSVPELVANGEYEKAVVVASKLHEAFPDSAEAEGQYRDASVAMLLELARRATFRDEDDEALYHLAKAAEIDPENETVELWRAKTSRKLSSIWLDRAQHYATQSDLQNATEAFERSLYYDPSSIAAMQGIGRMFLLMNYREGRGQAYYREGVRSLRSYWLYEARAKFNFASRKYMPGDESSTERAEKVENLLAEERISKAEDFESEGLYFAAGNEYRLALLLDPESEEAESGRERMEREMGAVEKLEHAEWLRLRGRFDEARVALSEGAELTDDQTSQFEVGVIDIEEEEFQLAYDEARRLEADYQYPAAAKAYEELLKSSGYYQDAITRRSVLLDSIEKVEDLYARAMESPEHEERLGFLRQIQLVWPEYRNVDELVKMLEAEAEATTEADEQ